LSYSIATVSLSGLLADKLRAANEAGFAAVEIFENDLLSAPQSPAEIRAMLGDLGLDCAMLQPFRDYEGMPADLRDRALERMRRKFKTMDDLGTDLILLCSNCSPQSSGERQQLIDDLGLLAETAAAHGKRIAYEALAWGSHINDHRDAWSLVRDVDHPALGLCLDAFHSLARDIPTASIGDIRGEKLFMPRQGDFDLVGYVAAIEKIGFSGYYSLEIFNDQFRSGLAGQVARDGHRSLVALTDSIAPISPAQQPVTPRKVEFIEFAASHEEAQEFGRMFRALGFKPSARHRSKDVVRWQQGEINLVLNSEPEGLAHTFDVVHGGSVCAIGLAIDDQQAALDRADRLAIPRHAQQIAPEEWEIPSVRAVGGSLIYLVDATTSDAMWAAEFPHQLETLGNGTLSRVDHIAQTMRYDEFLSWSLFYTSLFDMTKTPQLEIADPMGLVYSQAIESRDKAVRFTLNGSMAANALSSRFIQHYFGAGVQHLAFATDDIFTAADAARAAGLPTLDIGPNYYEDIEARFALDPALVERLAAHNILYDRDDKGEYFQFYSRAIAKRVFFEVVQRRDYDAYGAANASVRLNAQAGFRDPAGL
jgi:4-hydroxyphenylpyruvate dioxygenase